MPKQNRRQKTDSEHVFGPPRKKNGTFSFSFFVPKRVGLRTPTLQGGLWDRLNNDSKMFFVSSEISDAVEFHGCISFVLGTFPYRFTWYRAADQLHSCVAVQAPHDRRSRPVPCHGWKYHKSTQRPRILGVCTYYSCTLLEGLFNVYTIHILNLAATHNKPR